MRVLRLLSVGLLAVFAMVAGFFAVAVVIVTGLVGYLTRRLFGRPASVGLRPSPAARRQSSMRTDDVIDVVATKVPTERIGN